MTVIERAIMTAAQGIPIPIPTAAIEVETILTNHHLTIHVDSLIYVYVDCVLYMQLNKLLL